MMLECYAIHDKSLKRIFFCFSIFQIRMDFLPFRAQSFRGRLNFFFQNENAAGIVIQLIKKEVFSKYTQLKPDTNFTSF